MKITAVDPIVLRIPFQDGGAGLGMTPQRWAVLDTVLVRSLLVPALSYDLGRRIWWPSRLSRTSPSAESAAPKVGART